MTRLLPLHNIGVIQRTIALLRLKAIVWFCSLKSRIDFWSLRDTNQRDLLSPWRQPGLTRERRREEVAMVVPTHTRVRDFTNMLFLYLRESAANFSVDSSSEPLRELVVRAFLERRWNDPPIGIFEINDLESILRHVAWQLMVHGEAALAAFWDSPKHRERLPQFRFVSPSSLKVVKRQGQFDGYEISLPTSFPPQSFETIHLAAEDVVFFDWPLPSKAKRGVSPVDRVVDDFSEMWRLQEANLAIMRSWAYPEERSFRAERARWQNMGTILNRIGELDVAISSELYDPVANRPMTRYFDVYQLLKYRESLAIIREYLLDRFNIFVGHFSQLAGFTEGASLRLIGYPSAEEIRATLEKFTRREISADDAVALTKDATL